MCCVLYGQRRHPVGQAQRGEGHDHVLDDVGDETGITGSVRSRTQPVARPTTKARGIMIGTWWIRANRTAVMAIVAQGGRRRLSTPASTSRMDGSGATIISFGTDSDQHRVHQGEHDPVDRVSETTPDVRTEVLLLIGRVAPRVRRLVRAALVASRSRCLRRRSAQDVRSPTVVCG